MGAGALRGLQSRWALAEARAGGFDSLTPPPLLKFLHAQSMFPPIISVRVTCYENL